jgi:hypothetical protein
MAIFCVKSQQGLEQRLLQLFLITRTRGVASPHDAGCR